MENGEVNRRGRRGQSRTSDPHFSSGGKRAGAPAKTPCGCFWIPFRSNRRTQRRQRPASYAGPEGRKDCVTGITLHAGGGRGRTNYAGPQGEIENGTGAAGVAGENCSPPSLRSRSLSKGRRGGAKSRRSPRSPLPIFHFHFSLFHFLIGQSAVHDEQRPRAPPRRAQTTRRTRIAATAIPIAQTL